MGAGPPAGVEGLASFPRGRGKAGGPLKRVPQSTAAFSLIELLVTITVMVLLGAVLLPGLQSARQLACRTYCQNNLGQLAKAWQMYLMDSNGFFYQKVDADFYYGGWAGIRGALSRPLNPFLGLPESLTQATQALAFRCPGDRGGVPGISCDGFSYYGTSYRTNILLIGQNQVGPGVGDYQALHAEIRKYQTRLNLGRIADAGNLLLIGDYGWVNQWAPGVPFKTEWHNVAGSHNVAFTDGHVRFLKIRKGIYVSPDYRVLPFTPLDDLAGTVQREEP